MGGGARYQVVPAKASDLAQFLESKARDGFKPNTIVAYAIGISSYHLFIGLANPATEEIKDVLAGIKRRYGSPSLKTPGITLEVMEVIENTARKPRVGRSGKTETAEEAERRGLVDIALISFMRDGLLRYEHLCDLCWGDIIGNGDGSGKVRIITSNGGASWAYLSRKTMVFLLNLRGQAKKNELIFPLTRPQMLRLLRSATKHADLGDDFNLDSPRFGMTEDLLRSGEGLPAVMAAGRWSNKETLIRYFGDLLSAREMAKLHQSQDRRWPR